jgi:CyaY protein
MDEQEFERRADALFQQIERALDAVEGEGLDYEPRSGGVLEIEVVGRGKIVVNRHAARQEIWVAAQMTKAAGGGFHFAWNGEDWMDARSGKTLFACLEGLCAQAGVRLGLDRQ